MTTTYADILDRHQIDIPAHLVAQSEVPVLDGRQRQGDVYVRPERAGKNVGVPVPPEGVPVVRGEAGGNTHLLVGDEVLWAPSTSTSPVELTLGVLTVPAGRVAFLLHPEHGAQGFAPGTYRVGRQREQADEIRSVRD